MGGRNNRDPACTPHFSLFLCFFFFFCSTISLFPFFLFFFSSTSDLENAPKPLSPDPQKKERKKQDPVDGKKKETPFPKKMSRHSRNWIRRTMWANPGGPPEQCCAEGSPRLCCFLSRQKKGTSEKREQETRRKNRSARPLSSIKKENKKIKIGSRSAWLAPFAFHCFFFFSSSYYHLFFFLHFFLTRAVLLPGGLSCVLSFVSCFLLFFFAVTRN